MSASDPDDITTTEEISFEEMLAPGKPEGPESHVERNAADLEAVFDVPVRISVVLGRTKMAVSELLKLDTGTVIELDRQVGEAVEIFPKPRAHYRYVSRHRRRRQTSDPGQKCDFRRGRDRKSVV